jgi:hypothetical protein
MNSIPSIPLREILREINMSDLSRIVKDPNLRNMILSSASFKEIETRVILNCIDQLERNLDSQSEVPLFFYELMDDYFEPKGYDGMMYKDTPAYQSLMNLFYKNLYNFSYFDDEVLEQLREMQNDQQDILDVADFLNNWIESYPRLRNLFNQVEIRSLQIQNEYIQQIKKELFETSDSAYQNVQDYLDVLLNYLEKYYEDSPKVNEFYECLDQKEKIEKLLESVVRNKNKKRTAIETKSMMR